MHRRKKFTWLPLCRLSATPTRSQDFVCCLTTCPSAATTWMNRWWGQVRRRISQYSEDRRSQGLRVPRYSRRGERGAELCSFGQEDRRGRAPKRALRCLISKLPNTVGALWFRHPGRPALPPAWYVPLVSVAGRFQVHRKSQQISGVQCDPKFWQRPPQTLQRLCPGHSTDSPSACVRPTAHALFAKQGQFNPVPGQFGLSNRKPARPAIEHGPGPPGCKALNREAFDRLR
jgi:hypothetical protein